MTKLLPGQVNTNGVSNFLFGCNHPDYNNSFVTNTAIQAQLKANNVTVIRCPVEIGGTNCTDAQLDAMATAVANTGAKMLCILRYSDLTFSDHVVSYLGSRCNLYEFSNEPDLNGVSVSSYSSAWNAHVPTWRTSNPNAAFIGPALGAFSNVSSYLVPWLNNCVSSGVLPDAVSWHDYPCTSTGTIPESTCSLWAANIGNDAASLKSTVHSTLGYNLPLCLTEWNIDAYYGNSNAQSYSPNTPGNATFINSWTISAMDGMAANGVALACEFELNAYLVNDSAPSTDEPQMDAMETEYDKYIVQPVVDSPYGVMLTNNPGNDPTGVRMLNDAIKAGYSWMRYQVGWASIEKTQGVYTWTNTDALVQACNAAGIKLLMEIRNPPTWHVLSPDPCGNPNSVLMDPAAAATFAQVLVNHYNLGSAGTIAGMEWGNEDYEKGPNTCPPGSVAATLMNHVYPAIKALDSSIVVGPPATYMDKVTTPQWYGSFFGAGGGASIDYINIHCYPAGIGPNDPNKAGLTVSDNLQLVRNAAIAAGYSSMPIWMTENSWAVYYTKYPVTKAQQSLYYQEMLDDLRTQPALGVTKHFWFDIGAMTSGSPPSETYFPAFTMVQAYIQQYPTWSSITPPPTLQVSPTTLSSTSPGVSLSGSTYTATGVVLSELSSSLGAANWTFSSSMSGVLCSPSSGTLSPGGTVALTISGLPATEGSLTLSGAEGETPVSIAWTGAPAPPPPPPTQNSAYAKLIYSNNPTAWYRLGDKSNTIALDSSGNGYTATLSGATYGQPGAIVGDTDTAMGFTASGGLALPAQLMRQIASWTIGSLEFAINIDGTWQYCAVTMNGPTLTLYQNGALYVSGGALISNPTTSAILVSAMLEMVGSLTTAGILDEVVLYNYLLSTTQIANDYTAAINGGGTPPPASSAYTVTIDDNPVFVEAGSLIVDSSIGKRSTANFTAHTSTTTHFVEDMQVAIYDSSSNLAFSGYLTAPQEQKPGYQPSLEQTITCCDQHRIADKRIIAAVYTQRTCGEIVQSIINNYLAQEGVTVGMIYDGLPPAPALYPSATLYPAGNVGLVPTATFAYCTVAAALDSLATEASGAGIPYYWQIDQYKQLYFVPYNAIINPNIIDGTQLLQDSNHAPQITRSNPLYRNTQYIVGGTAQTLPQSEVHVGDGSSTSFAMGYDLALTPQISINTGSGQVSQTVGVKGVSKGQQWYWQAGSPVITQDSSGTKLRGYPYNDTLLVNYVGQYPNVIISQNQAQINYEASIDGTSGIVEEVETDKTLTSVSSGLTEADAFLSRYAIQGIQFVGYTPVSGYAPGQSVIVNLPEHGLVNAQMLINKVEASDQVDGYNIWYTITGVIGPYDTSWEFFFSKMINQQQQANSINVGVSSNLVILADFTASITMSAVLNVTSATCPLPGITQYPGLSLYPC